MNWLKLHYVKLITGLSIFLLFCLYVLLKKESFMNAAKAAKKKEIQHRVKIATRIAEKKKVDSHINTRLEEIDNEIKKIDSEKESIEQMDFDSLSDLDDQLKSLGY